MILHNGYWTNHTDQMTNYILLSIKIQLAKLNSLKLFSDRVNYGSDGLFYGDMNEAKKREGIRIAKLM